MLSKAIISTFLCSFQEHFPSPKDFADGVIALSNKHFESLVREMQVLA
jgi:hypothetical protein